MAVTALVSALATEKASDTRRIRLLLAASVVLAPLVWLSQWASWGSGTTFILAALAVIPLAGLTAIFSERLGDSTGIPWVAKLLNIVMDNIVFIVLGITSLYEGLTSVVKASIAGALISNTLFVLGLCFFLGNMRGKPQTFKASAALDYSKLLAIVVIALVIPALVEVATDIQPTVKNDYSGFVAVLLLVNYLGYIGHEVFGWFKIRDTKAGDTPPQPFQFFPPLRTEASAATRSLRASLMAFVALAAALFFTALVSIQLANTTVDITTGEPMRFVAWEAPKVFAFSQTFVGLVIIPIIGSVAEHVNTILTAIGGSAKAGDTSEADGEETTIDAVIENTAGTALQVSMLAAPIFVLYSLLFIPQHVFGLYFDGIEIIVIALGTFLFYLVTEDGKGTWHEGLTLLTLYAIFVGAALLIVR